MKKTLLLTLCLLVVANLTAQKGGGLSKFLRLTDTITKENNRFFFDSYLSAKIDYIPDYAMASSIGYFITPQHGIGISRVDIGGIYETEGVGICYRYLPGNRFIFKASLGYLTSDIQDRYERVNSYTTLMKANYKHIYFNLGFSVRFFRVFTFGFDWVGTPNQDFAYYIRDDRTGEYLFDKMIKQNISIFAPTLGVSIPSHHRESKISKAYPNALINRKFAKPKGYLDYDFTLSRKTTSMAAGVRINQKNAVGLVYNNGMTDFNFTAKGVGLQYKWFPLNDLSFNIITGKILEARKFQLSNQDVYKYAPPENQTYYAQASCLYHFFYNRFGSFHAGINYFYIPDIHLKYKSGWQTLEYKGHIDQLFFSFGGTLDIGRSPK